MSKPPPLTPRQRIYYSIMYELFGDGHGFVVKNWGFFVLFGGFIAGLLLGWLL